MSDPLGVVGVVLADKFRVDRLIGEGGFGVVYAGVHTVIGEPIAVKFIKVDAAASDPKRAAEEFLREARILFSLSHPAIVRMYDVGALERGAFRLPWVVLELLSGPTLEEEISQRRRDRRPMSAAELRAIFEPILDGLTFAHGRGIMHRDLKPSNILLSRAASGALEPKLLDFGTARTQLSALQTSLGRTGFTPLYGAPEQWDPSLAPPTPATDVYALALTLLECATLQRPHENAQSLPAIMQAVMGGAGLPRLLEVRPDLPASFASVVERGLSVQPAQRFRDAGELRAALWSTTVSPYVTASPHQTTGPSYGSPHASTALPPMMMVAPAAPQAPFRTTAAPFVATAPPRTTTPSSSSLGVVAIVLAALALLGVVGAVVVGALYLRGQTARGPDNPASTSPAAPVARGPVRAISPPSVGSSVEFDRPDAVAVTTKNHPSIEACAARSRRFNGTIALVLDVSTRDGRVIGTDCQTVWPSHDSKHPKLDPEAAELCGCIQGVTASWKFKPPKPEIAMPIGEDTAWLRVQYVCAR